MWYYCGKCRVEWHSHTPANVCDLCQNQDILYSEHNKIGVDENI